MPTKDCFGRKYTLTERAWICAQEYCLVLIGLLYLCWNFGLFSKLYEGLLPVPAESVQPVTVSAPEPAAP